MRTAPLCLLLLPLAAAPLGGAPAPSPRPNLLVNGSFEEGPAVGDYRAFAAGSREVRGWLVTRQSVDLVGGYWRAAHGSRSIDLHGSPGLGGISQSFATRPGRRYLVTFALAGNPDGTVPKKVLALSAAGEAATFTCDAAGKSRKAMGWQKKSWRFTATGRRTTLEFYTLMRGDEACGPVVDDVCVAEAR